MSDVKSKILEKIKNNIPTKTFVYNDVEVLVRQYAPGTAMKKRGSALIKMHRHLTENEDDGRLVSDLTEEEAKEYAQTIQEGPIDLCENFIECVVTMDKEEVKDWLTVEIALENFTAEFMNMCVEYAMGEASIPDKEDLNEVDRFHRQDTE